MERELEKKREENSMIIHNFFFVFLFLNCQIMDTTVHYGQCPAMRWGRRFGAKYRSTLAFPRI